MHANVDQLAMLGRTWVLFNLRDAIINMDAFVVGCHILFYASDGRWEMAEVHLPIHAIKLPHLFSSLLQDLRHVLRVLLSLL